MNMQRKPIRAATRVVAQQRKAEPWTLERARLARLHADAIAAKDASCRLAVSRAEARGRHDGQQDVLRSSFEDAEFRRYFVRAAAENLGASVGRQMAEDFKSRIDPILEERHRLFHARLAVAEISFDLKDNAFSSDRAIVTRVDLPRQDFHFARSI